MKTVNIIIPNNLKDSTKQNLFLVDVFWNISLSMTTVGMLFHNHTINANLFKIRKATPIFYRFFCYSKFITPIKTPTFNRLHANDKITGQRRQKYSRVYAYCSFEYTQNLALKTVPYFKEN